jgi:hypothetical protein
MSIFNDVKELAGGSKQSKDWYRSQVFYGLEDSKGFKVGDVIFFAYSAATKDLPFYDKYPMVLITDIDMANQQFSGGNIHYLRPSTRISVAKSWGGGSVSYPRRCHHKYFMSNASNIKTVSSADLKDMKYPLPLEQFTMNVVGRYLDVPSSIIWSRQ